MSLPNKGNITIYHPTSEYIWVPIDEWVLYKVLLMVSKALHNSYWSPELVMHTTKKCACNGTLTRQNGTTRPLHTSRSCFGHTAWGVEYVQVISGHWLSQLITVRGLKAGLSASLRNTHLSTLETRFLLCVCVCVCVKNKKIEMLMNPNVQVLVILGQVLFFAALSLI